MRSTSKITYLFVRLRKVLSSFLESIRIFIFTTFFRHKAEALDKKSKFEMSGSNPGKSVQEEKLKNEMSEEVDKFEELLAAAFGKIDDLKQGDSKGLLEKLVDDQSYEQGMIENAYPTYILDIEEDMKWLYSVQRKTYVPVKAGAEVIPVVVDSEKDEYFCVINNELFNVDEDLVTCIGWN